MSHRIKDLLLTLLVILLTGAFFLTGMGRKALLRTTTIYKEIKDQRKLKTEDQRMEYSFSTNYTLPRYIKNLLAQDPGMLLLLPPSGYVWEHNDTRTTKPSDFIWTEPLTWTYYFGPIPVVSLHHPMARQATYTVMYNPAGTDLQVVKFENEIQRAQIISLFEATEQKYKTADKGEATK